MHKANTRTYTLAGMVDDDDTIPISHTDAAVSVAVHKMHRRGREEL